MLLGYPTQAPQPQYAEAPMKAQTRGEKGHCGGLYEFNSIFHCIYTVIRINRTYLMVRINRRKIVVALARVKIEDK
jgi:hypothetical protein